MWASRSRVHGEWNTSSVYHCHEVRIFAPLGLFHIAPLFRYHEGAVKETFGEFDLSSGLQVQRQSFEQMP